MDKTSIRRFSDKVKVYYPVTLAIIILFVLGEALSPGFLGNFNNILMIASFLAIVCIGQSLVIMVGGFGLDLSIGAMVTLGALLTGKICNGSSVKLFLLIPVLIFAGIIVGLINGIGVQKLKIPPLAMTLIVSNVIVGFYTLITRAMPTLNIPSVLTSMGKPLIGPLRTMTVIAVIFIVVFELILRKQDMDRKSFYAEATETLRSLPA